MNAPLTIRRPLFLAALTAATGIILSGYIHSRIAKNEADAARMTSETLRLNTEQELNLFADVLQSVCALHALSDAVNQAAMDEFIKKGMVYQQAILGPFGLTQRIGPQIRTAMEQQAAAIPGTGYRVLQSGPDGSWIPVEPKPVYYPLTWQSQTDGLNIPVGFDFSSLNEETRQAIRRVEQSRRPVLVPAPIFWNQRTEDRDQKSDFGTARILHSTSHNSQFPLTSDLRSPTSIGAAKPAYWVFAPVILGQIQPDSPYTSGGVIGFAVAILHPDVILQRVARLAVPSAGLNMRLTVAKKPDQTETVRLSRGMWNCSRPLNAIGTHWIFECSFPAAVTGRRSTMAFIAGLLITAFLTSQLLMLARRTRKIEAEVRARTRELRIANAQLEETLHERARLEEEMNELSAREQRRIGRDLHDSLGQQLTGATFLSRSLLNWFEKHGAQKTEVSSQRTEDGEQRAEDNSEPRTPNSELSSQTIHAHTLNETLKSAVAQVRNMARGLASVTLNEESLDESLEQLAEEMSALYSTRCTVERSEGLPDLDRKTKEQLYFITREAVNNAARHATPARITIHLGGSGTGWLLRVEDDGAGMSGTPAGGEGMGLRIMRHRAGRIGAQFSITSAPGKGTIITVSGTV